MVKEDVSGGGVTTPSIPVIVNLSTSRLAEPFGSELRAELLKTKPLTQGEGK